VALAMHPRIRVERRAVDDWPDGPVIVATGPLTAGPIGALIRRELGGDRMYFYDAIAPIVAADSIDLDHAFRASRWNRESTPDGAVPRSRRGRDVPGPHNPKPPASPDDPAAEGGDVGDVSVGDYINCPLDKAQYTAFVEALRAAEKVAPREFEKVKYFEGCLPVEVMAERGDRTLAFGPMKPVGLTDPRTGRWPYAVVQLRPEDEDRSAYNMVGFQTRMKWPEQQRDLRDDPGAGAGRVPALRLDPPQHLRRRAATCSATRSRSAAIRGCGWPAC
jgi:methylenetetrahydrofolate--tRNA-(uracil-5-)-methyltransferase